MLAWRVVDHWCWISAPFHNWSKLELLVWAFDSRLGIHLLFYFGIFLYQSFIVQQMLLPQPFRTHNIELTGLCFGRFEDVWAILWVLMLKATLILRPGININLVTANSTLSILILSIKQWCLIQSWCHAMIITLQLLHIWKRSFLFMCKYTFWSCFQICDVKSLVRCSEYAFFIKMDQIVV